MNNDFDGNFDNLLVANNPVPEKYCKGETALDMAKGVFKALTNKKFLISVGVIVVAGALYTGVMTGYAYYEKRQEVAAVYENYESALAKISKLKGESIKSLEGYEMTDENINAYLAQEKFQGRYNRDRSRAERNANRLKREYDRLMKEINKPLPSSQLEETPANIREMTKFSKGHVKFSMNLRSALVKYKDEFTAKGFKPFTKKKVEQVKAVAPVEIKKTETPKPVVKQEKVVKKVEKPVVKPVVKKEEPKAKKDDFSDLFNELENL